MKESLYRKIETLKKSQPSKNIQAKPKEEQERIVNKGAGSVRVSPRVRKILISNLT